MTGAGIERGRADYWEDYYAHQGAGDRPIPSQFATFVGNELHEPHRVIDFGCGNGRDALFFSLYGHHVIGIDASPSAVKRSSELAAALGLAATFHEARIDEPDLSARIETGPWPTLVYARFFLHVIDDDEEQLFLQLASSLTGPGDLLAVEYRTVRDASNTKVTNTHYRRFVQPPVFQARASALGFDVEYGVEGFGFAKYERDDAYVARCLLRRG